MKIHAFYFSPTHTTEQITTQIGLSLKNSLGYCLENFPLTKAPFRDTIRHIPSGDILLLGLPVYSGRIPSLLENTLQNIKGNGNPAIIVSIYGNRNFDDALLEMKDILVGNSFNVIAAGAFIGEHSFSRKIATNRPDSQDIAAISAFATKCTQKILAKQTDDIYIIGNRPYKERPPSLQIAPETTGFCNNCMICFNTCPTQAIQANPRLVLKEKCIRCFACIKSCPLSAKHFNNENISKAINWLESNFIERKEPEFFF